MKCPCCNGTGEVAEETVQPAPVPMTRLQFRIWDILRRSDGINISALVGRTYANRADGGPEHARESVYVTISKLNRRLAPIGQKIVSLRTGGYDRVYRVMQLDGK